MHKIVALLVVGHLFAVAGQAEIREIKKMSQIVPEVDAETLLVFDIDNTIAKPAQSLGSDQWYEHLVAVSTRENIAKGMTKEEAESKAIDSALEHWEKVQRVTRASLVEAETAAIISQAQAAGTVVMALTARPISLAEATAAQLGAIGVSMKGRPPKGGEVEVKLEHPAKLVDGILFVGPKNNKGRALGEIIAQLGLKPKNVVFVDDKPRHVKNVDGVMKEKKIPCVAFRYGAADAIVAAFNPKLTDVEWKYFGAILSDEAAQTLLGASKRQR